MDKEIELEDIKFIFLANKIGSSVEWLWNEMEQTSLFDLYVRQTKEIRIFKRLNKTLENTQKKNF